MSRIKIVATIGPSTNNPATIRGLLHAGMDVARLNGAHADLSWHAEAVELLRSVAPEVPIIFDVPGRKVRTRLMKDAPTFSVGDTIILTTDDDYAGEGKVPVNNPHLHHYLKPGDVLVADDGILPFTVLEVIGRDVLCRAEASGKLRSAIGINVPSVDLQGISDAEGDSERITFAKEKGIDFVGLSFIGAASHVRAVGDLIGKQGPRIVSKIESRSGMENLDEIIEASDSIMIDRGDLSVETTLENVALFQKSILGAARRLRKPAIVATQMLHSMIERAVPTKAEVSDITNAVLDGAAALMLSGETAVGRYPVEAVTMMRRIADTVAESLQSSLDQDTNGNTGNVPEAMAEAISVVCRRVPVSKIVAVTISGYAARVVASYRPRQPILAVTNDQATARCSNLLPGTEGIFVNISFSRTSTDHIALCLEELWRRGKLVDDDVILVTSVGYPRSGNRMNLIHTHSVSDLRESLGWAR